MSETPDEMRLDSTGSTGCRFARENNGKVISQKGGNGVVKAPIPLPYAHCVQPEECRCKWVLP